MPARELKWVRTAITAPPLRSSKVITMDGRHCVPVVRAAVVVDVGIPQLEVAGRVGGDDLSRAVVALALGPGHKEGDTPARPQVVVDHGYRAARTPPLLELAGVGP